jgi:hypothetical protein
VGGSSDCATGCNRPLVEAWLYRASQGVLTDSWAYVRVGRVFGTCASQGSGRVWQGSRKPRQSDFGELEPFFDGLEPTLHT